MKIYDVDAYYTDSKTKKRVARHFKLAILSDKNTKLYRIVNLDLGTIWIPEFKSYNLAERAIKSANNLKIVKEYKLEDIEKE